MRYSPDATFESSKGLATKATTTKDFLTNEKQSLKPRLFKAQSMVVLLLLLTDALAAGAALYLIATVMLAGASHLGSELPAEIGLFVDRLSDVPLLVGLLLITMAYGGLYKRRNWELDELRNVTLAVALLLLIDFALIGAEPTLLTGLGLVASWMSVVVFIFTGRMIVRSLPPVARLMTGQVVLLGKGMEPEQLAAQFRCSRSEKISVLASLPLEAPLAHRPEHLIETLILIATARGVDPSEVEVVVAPGPNEGVIGRRVTSALERANVPLALILPYQGLARAGVEFYNPVGCDVVVARVTAEEEQFVQKVTKRLADIVLSSVLLVVLAVPMLLVAAVIALDGGPAFFAQERVARHGRTFRLLKFRSMRVDAEEALRHVLATDPVAREQWEKHQKLEDDPRITLFGSFIRRTSIDELPQLLNVLLGDMSLVGPRPIVAPSVSSYSSDQQYAASDDFRHYAAFRPGITGLWQVSGRSSTPHRERVRLDRWYAKNWSLWLDLVILFKTAKAVCDRSGQ